LVAKVYYFENCDKGFLALMSQKLSSVVFPPKEVVDQVDTIHMLTKGVAAKGGRILGVNSVWGEDLILDSWELMDSTAAIALTFIEVARLHKADIVEGYKWFPEVRAGVRKAAVRMATRRGVVQYARKLAMMRRGTSAREIRRKTSWLAETSDIHARSVRLRQMEAEEVHEKTLLECSDAYEEAAEQGPAIVAQAAGEGWGRATFNSIAHARVSTANRADVAANSEFASASDNEFHVVKMKVRLACPPPPPTHTHGAPLLRRNKA
jgi:hypothetical protein